MEVTQNDKQKITVPWMEKKCLLNTSTNEKKHDKWV